jgi:hypothetical protein
VTPRLLAGFSVAGLALVVALALLAASPGDTASPAAAAAQAGPVRIVAAGDIACDPEDANYNGGLGTTGFCRMMATSQRALDLDPDAVLVLGDLQYENATLAKFQASYDPSWGRLKAISYPAVGNHEYLTANATGYYTYFGAAAGDPTKGWYSFDLGGWHLIALNSNCNMVGGCLEGSPQHDWLLADLAANPGVCTLAFWHHPRFSSGPHGDDIAYTDFWEALQDAGADVVLAGHDHVYERFDLQDANGVADPDGLRHFTVGTGGKNRTSFPVVRANSEVRLLTFGVLALDLHADGYVWEFHRDDGTVLDSGVQRCHSAAAARPPATFHTIAPCRVADTRLAAGPSGGPALRDGDTRVFPVGGTCGIPADAVAVAFNLTAASPTATGHLTAYPAGVDPPLSSAVNFRRNRSRASNGALELGVGGMLAVDAALVDPDASVHLILDASGYFQAPE